MLSLSKNSGLALRSSFDKLRMTALAYYKRISTWMTNSNRPNISSN